MNMSGRRVCYRGKVMSGAAARTGRGKKKETWKIRGIKKPGERQGKTL